MMQYQGKQSLKYDPVDLERKLGLAHAFADEKPKKR